MPTNIRFFEGQPIPLEMHKVRLVQKLTLKPIEARAEAISEAGYNTFLLKNDSIFLDMLTDSGVNAMSDRQLAAMMLADDSYAGSASFEKLKVVTEKIFNKKFILPVHQGRAAEHILSTAFVKPGHIVPMNYHFTTSRAHVLVNGGEVVELMSESALKPQSSAPFKGNMDVEALGKFLKENAERVPFVRMEAGTNLIGGQPWSLENLQAVSSLCRAHKIPLVMDASLLSDNLYFIKMREDSQKDVSLADIVTEISDLSDIIYFSARKLGSAKGGVILTNDESVYKLLMPFITLYEGFLTYGGMSVREIEAMAVGLEESLDFDMIRHGPEFIKYMTDALVERSVPVITPSGGLGCHLDASAFLNHLPQDKYLAASLAAALFIAGGVRGMERGSMSEERLPDGSEKLADIELVRLALPRRVFTLSQVKYAVDRISWLYQNRELIEGLKWQEEPEILRFFTGRMSTVSAWPQKLVEKFREDFGDSL